MVAKAYDHNVCNRKEEDDSASQEPRFSTLLLNEMTLQLLLALSFYYQLYKYSYLLFALDQIQRICHLLQITQTFDLLIRFRQLIQINLIHPLGALRYYQALIYNIIWIMVLNFKLSMLRTWKQLQLATKLHLITMLESFIYEYRFNLNTWKK